MDNVTKNLALRKAISQFDSLKSFAEALDVRYQVVQQWLGNRVPAEYCPRIERVTNRQVRCEELRPEIDWAYLRQQDSTAISP